MRIAPPLPVAKRPRRAGLVVAQPVDRSSQFDPTRAEEIDATGECSFGSLEHAGRLAWADRLISIGPDSLDRCGERPRRKARPKRVNVVGAKQSFVI
jgi:hypothetical protein